MCSPAISPDLSPILTPMKCDWTQPLQQRSTVIPQLTLKIGACMNVSRLWLRSGWKYRGPRYTEYWGPIHSIHGLFVNHTVFQGPLQAYYTKSCGQFRASPERWLVRYFKVHVYFLYVTYCIVTLLQSDTHALLIIKSHNITPYY